MGEPIPTDRDRAIYHRTGHYMADVAELLQVDGYAVISISSCQPEELQDAEDDGGGYVDLGLETLAQINGAPKDGLDLHLTWDTSSGWALVVEARGISPVTRWMGGGLAPAPEKVAGFFLSGLLDFRNAGSEDRPYYRQTGNDLDGLARLAPFDKRGSFSARFRHTRNAIAERLAINAVLPEGEDAILSVPVRAGELAALQHLIHHAGLSVDLREASVLLIADLKARAVPTDDKNHAQAVTDHSAGVEQAKRVRRKRQG
ncbi:DUF6292 family protein (plasmid) [Streptomyces sp. NBC_01216]|uniref:DUF6292 family protein n=1 Tax=Streptomyces sp. NBC_01216 TaxID=2903778 RepID=UPI002E116E18|nr:DUF6292 family protein [Streptomyces sp. NBC_01216]